jgi:protein-S-isoprenylcysteine O-methyltransferase Ste14
MDTPLPIWFLIIIPIIYVLLLGLIPIFIAGKGLWGWIEAWIYAVSVSLVTSISLAFVNKNNPRVLRNRLKTKKEGITKATEKPAGTDRIIIPMIGVTYFLTLYFPAVSLRLEWGWDAIPFGVELFGVVISILGIVITFLAMNENAYASKLLDISKDQKLIDTGVYGIVRHPMYTGFSLLFLGTPVALGSWVSIFFGALTVFLLIYRIRFEEEMLVVGLEGYVDYRERVKYRLIPGIY